MAYGLLKRILLHAKEQGWLKEGCICVDPFFGIGSTGILGAYENIQVIGIELEEKFCKLAEQNFELHRKAWEKFNNPFPIIIQGDSRRLCEVVEKADMILSSPPYSEQPKANRTDHGILNHKEDCKCNFCAKNRGNKGMVQGYRQADCIVSSPPYTEAQTTDKNSKRQAESGYWDKSTNKKLTGKYSEQNGQSSSGNLGAMKPGKVDMVVSSPPFCETTSDKPSKNIIEGGLKMGQSSMGDGYGQTSGNLGNLKSGDVDAIISSPPYAETPVEQTHMTSNKRGDESDPNYRPSWKKKLKDGYAETKRPYGKSKDNLGNLKSGDVDCVISSPPWENQEGSMQSKKFKAGSAKMLSDRNAEGKTKGHYATPAAIKRAMDKANRQDYGNSEGQLGQEQGNTFWSAAHTILEQCYQILKPGGHAIWVVKSFVRNKKIVDFPGDWQRLCESVGFKTVCVHHAMLVKETTHQTLFGDTEVKRKERKSFFRRLAESKGSPRIDFEVVLCMRKKKG